MRTAMVRVKGIRFAIASAIAVAVCAWWSIPWVRQHVAPALPSLSISSSTESAALLGEAEQDASPGERHWLKRVLVPAKPLDPKQQALAQLEASGMPFTGDGFVRAVGTGHQPLVDLFLAAGIQVDALAADGRTALLAATLGKDWKLAERFIQLGANVNAQDENGLTPLMAAAMADHLPTVESLVQRGATLDAVDLHEHAALHYAVATRSVGSIQTLLKAGADCSSSCCDGRDLMSHATETRDWRIVEPILARHPGNLTWDTFTRAELISSLNSQDAPKAKLLLAKHAQAPAPEGSEQPLLAHLMLSDNIRAFKFLLASGADPNTPLNSPVSQDFAQRVSQGYLKHYLTSEPGMTTLMLAAGLSRPDYVQALLDAGASRGIATKKYKMPALLFATRGDSTEVSQMLIGDCPKPEQLRVHVSIGSQRASIIKNGATAFSTSVSTGRSGFSTPTGNFVITDKHRSHMSTIYKVKMPFFMRLNARDFGLHQGVVPGYPASHGCIRVPAGTAQKLFAELPVGTMVSITN